METSQRITPVSAQQLDILWEFLNVNRDIANDYNPSSQAKVYAKTKWTELAEILNSQGDGTHKDWKGWSKYWVDFKARVAAVRSSHGRTGSGPSTEKPLTEVEVKFLQVLGEDFGEALPSVRVEQFPEPQDIISAPVDKDVQDSPASESSSPNLPSIHIPPIEMPTLDTLPQPPCLTRSPTQTIQPPLQTTTRYPRRRRQRRELPITSEGARRAIIRSYQIRAEAAVRSANAMVTMAQITAQIRNTAENIERVFSRAFHAAAGQGNSE